MATVDRTNVVNSTIVWKAVQIISKSDAYDVANNIEIPTKQSVAVYISNKLAELINSSPAALDTLKELANALGNDPNFATTVTNNIATKIEKAIFTAANQLILSTGAGTYSAKTLDEIKTLLNLNLTENGANKIPVGTVFVGYYPSTPAGFLKFGTYYSKTTYNTLYLQLVSLGLGATHPTDSTLFITPESRADVIRLLDEGRGIDSGRTTGSEQLDSIAEHNHDISYASGQAPDGTTGTGIAVSDVTVTKTATYVTNVINARVTAENRVRNVALPGIIKY